VRKAWRAVLVGVSTIGLAGQAWAEPLRLEERVVPACVVAARELRPRIEGALGGSLPSELRASVTIEAFGAGYRVHIALRDVEARGATVIEAPTCDEAVDAAAVVLALAFGKPSTTSVDDSSTSIAEPERGMPSERVQTPVFGSFEQRRGESAPVDEGSTSDLGRAMRITLATGVDGGTLPLPTLTLAGAIARPFGGVEVAAIARYGLPIADERVESDFSASRRQDFGGLELRACRGVGDSVRVAACAGTEVGAVRARRTWESEERTDLEASLTPRLSGTLAALVAHRGGLVEPGLELGAAAVALGRSVEAPWLVVRVAAGAAIAF
jgi:hypothetical protein